MHRETSRWAESTHVYTACLSCGLPWLAHCMFDMEKENNGRIHAVYSIDVLVYTNMNCLYIYMLDMLSMCYTYTTFCV